MSGRIIYSPMVYKDEHGCDPPEHAETVCLGSVWVCDTCGRGYVRQDTWGKGGDWMPLTGVELSWYMCLEDRQKNADVLEIMQITIDGMILDNEARLGPL